MRSRKKIKIKNLLSKNYTQAIEIPVKISFEEPNFLFSLMRKSLVKFTAFILIAALNWAGLSAVIQTIANFNDTEGSPQNIFVATTLDFSLDSPPDFSPVIMPNATSSRNISLTNDGILGFQYTATTTNATGTLCSFLNLEAKLDGTTTYIGPLTSFNFNANEFSTSTDDWQFTATLTSNSPALQNKTCKFDFVFDGEQIEGAGFYDQEIISNTITSGIWQKVVINKVYYDVCPKYGVEPDNEWIELYNVTENPVDLSDWEICDNHLCDTLPDSYVIPAGGFAIITDKSTTWNYWDIPPEVVKIVLNSPIGNSLDNDADMLILKNEESNIIDQMNWGTPTSTWPNYNANVWDPGAPDVFKGHILARVPTGLDTDTVSDWKDLGLPSVVMIYPVGGETWYVGHTYKIEWTATNPNGDQDPLDLSIDIYYSRDSGATWAAIATSTQNDGSYNWLAPLFIEPVHYYVPSPHARIKVKATGPENFMVQAWVSSNDFCPPIDYDVLSLEDQQLVDQLILDGVIDESEVIRGGVKIDEQQPEVVNEEIATSTEETATPTEETLVPAENDSTGNGNQENGGIIETVNEAIVAADGAIDTVVEGIIEEIIPDEPAGEPAESVEVPADNLIVENLIIEQAPIEETLIIEQAPATEEQAVIAPDNNSAEPPAGE